MNTTWEIVKLDRFFVIKKGQTITKKDSNPGIYPVILGGREPAYYIDKYNHTGKAIVVSRSGASAGYVSFWNEPIFVTDGFLIEPKDDVNYEFVYYLLKLKQSQLLGSQRGAAIPHVTPNLLYNVQAFFPPLPTQKQIASILSAYDNLIENNNKRIKILEQMAENLYKEWFVRFRFPGHETTPSENGIPKGWRVEKVANYAKIKSGYAFKSEWWQNNGFPVIKIKDIDNGSIDIANLDCVSEEHANKAKSFLLSEGDLVIAMTGATIGKIGLVPKIDNLYTNQRVGKFFLGKNPFEKMPILYCLFSQPTTIELILGLSGASSAQPNISPDQLGRIEFFYEEKIVKEFNRINTPIFKEILKLREHNLSLIKQRDLLLPRLMSGKLAV